MDNFQISDNSVRSISLTGAILLYGLHGTNSTSYATQHEVMDNPDGGQPIIRAGRPVDRKSLARFAKDLSAGTMGDRHGLLPLEVLSIGADHVVWWRKACRQNLFFSTNNEGVGNRSGTVPLPSLIFAAKGKDLWVYAIKHRGRPLANTPLYHAPFMNVWKDGKVCTGSAPLPDETLTSTLDAWTNSFMNSYFTHPNHPKSVRYEGGSHAFWTAMLDGKFPEFPNDVLVNHKTKLADLISAVEGAE